MVNAPYRTATLTEDQIQTLLEFALVDGGLAAARADYQNPLIADAPTAVFEINADGIEKTVSVVALGLEDMEPNADTAIKLAMAELGARLRDFDAGGTLGSVPYEPAGYRAVLTPAERAPGRHVHRLAVDGPCTGRLHAAGGPDGAPAGQGRHLRLRRPRRSASTGSRAGSRAASTFVTARARRTRSPCGHCSPARRNSRQPTSAYRSPA